MTLAVFLFELYFCIRVLVLVCFGFDCQNLSNYVCVCLYVNIFLLSRLCIIIIILKTKLFNVQNSDSVKLG